MMIVKSHPVRLAVLALGLVLLFGACAKKDERDQFLEKWKQKAEETKDKTYTPAPQKVDFSQLQVKPEERKPEKPQRNLPTMKVSLNFYDTDLQAVLRSMARIANQNIILSAALQSSESQGKYKVNLNVSDTPWDQAFNAILNANGLSYDWDGEIIRVMTLDDMKAQNAMKKAIEEKMAQNEKLKDVEPMVTVKVQVNYADVTDLEKTLKSYLASPTASTQGGASAPAQGGQGAPGTPGGSGGGEDLAGKIKGMVVADKFSNSIIIQAAREHADMLVQLVKKLDEPRLQVHLQAFIVEASRTALTDIGMQWGGTFKTGVDANGNRLWIVPGGNSSNQNSGGGAQALGTQLTGAPTAPILGTQQPIFGNGPAGSGYTLNFPAAITPSASGLGSQGAAINFLWGILGQNILQNQLTALAKDGKISILSEPSLTTQDNSMAFTENGKKVPYVTTSQNGTNVQFVDAVLRLEMTPHVIDEKNLRLKISIKDDELITDQSQWVQGNPPILKKQTDTTLIVENGSTIIISGLSQHTNSIANQGVPGFKDIPGVGYLFKDHNTSSDKEDLLVFITPTVLRSPAAQSDEAPATPSPLGSAPPSGQGQQASPERQPMPLGQAPAQVRQMRPGG